MNNRVKRIIDPAGWILSLCFGISLTTFIIYLTGINYNDTTLFLLLAVMRYSSFMLCFCAFYKLSLNIYRSIRDRKFSLKILIYLLIIIYGIVIILIDAFIVTFSGGNG